MSLSSRPVLAYSSWLLLASLSPLQAAMRPEGYLLSSCHNTAASSLKGEAYNNGPLLQRGGTLSASEDGEEAGLPFFIKNEYGGWEVVCPLRDDCSSPMHWEFLKKRSEAHASMLKNNKENRRRFYGTRRIEEEWKEAYPPAENKKKDAPLPDDSRLAGADFPAFSLPDGRDPENMSLEDIKKLHERDFTQTEWRALPLGWQRLIEEADREELYDCCCIRARKKDLCLGAAAILCGIEMLAIGGGSSLACLFPHSGRAICCGSVMTSMGGAGAFYTGLMAWPYCHSPLGSPDPLPPSYPVLHEPACWSCCYQQDQPLADLPLGKWCGCINAPLSLCCYSQCGNGYCCGRQLPQHMLMRCCKPVVETEAATPSV